MVDYPAIKWVGAASFATGRRGYTPKAIVIHIAEGSMAALDSWFNNPQAGVSAHYGISKRGAIHQYVREQDTAHGNGVIKAPSWSFLGMSRSINPNLYTISIEHEGKTGELWTPAMIEADVNLIAAICTRYGIPADSEHIIPHAAIDSVNKARCPGKGCPLEKIIQRVHERLDAPPVDPEPEKPEEIDWQTRFIELFGVTELHKQTLEWIAANSTDENARQRAEAALAGQWQLD
jgi:N-acetylmuramoyl-L-alanine amidase